MDSPLTSSLFQICNPKSGKEEESEVNVGWKEPDEYFLLESLTSGTSMWVNQFPVVLCLVTASDYEFLVPGGYIPRLESKEREELCLKLFQEAIMKRK